LADSEDSRRNNKVVIPSHQEGLNGHPKTKNVSTITSRKSLELLFFLLVFRNHVIIFKKETKTVGAQSPDFVRQSFQKKRSHNMVSVWHLPSMS